MNKILLSGLAGLAVINAANAGIKESCLQKPDKLVWVEKTERCVPINTCKAKDRVIVGSYCNKAFAEIEVGNHEQADKLARKYIEVKMGKSVTSGGVLETTLVGQDYYAYKLSDGGYVVFEFGDTSDRTERQVQFGIVRGVCEMIYDHEIVNFVEKGGLGFSNDPSKYSIPKGFSMTCYATEDMYAQEFDCREMADLIADISGFSVDYYFDESAAGTSMICSINFL